MTQRTHITRSVLIFLSKLMFTIHMNRFHYQDCLAGCKAKGIEPKAQPPTHFKSDNQFVFMLSLLPWYLVLFFRMQVKIDSFTTTMMKLPPIVKASLKEFLLELVADANLVSNYLSIR